MTLDEVGNVSFGVTVLARMRVEHELRQRALELRQAAFEHCEPRARHPARGVEIQHAEALAEGDVIQRLEIERARFTPAANIGIRRFVLAIGYVIHQQVGQAEFDILDLALHSTELLLGRGQLLTQVLDRGEQGFDVFTRRLRLAHGPGTHVALIAQRLDLDLQRFALFLECEIAIGVETAARATAGQVRGNVMCRLS